MPEYTIAEAVDAELATLQTIIDRLLESERDATYLLIVVGVVTSAFLFAGAVMRRPIFTLVGFCGVGILWLLAASKRHHANTTRREKEALNAAIEMRATNVDDVTLAVALRARKLRLH